MTDRIIDLSDAAVALKVRHEQLLIDPPGGEAVSVPLADIAVVVAAHPHVRYTQAVLAGLAKHGGILVACDRLPSDPVQPGLRLLPDAGGLRSCRRSDPCRGLCGWNVGSGESSV